MTIYRPSQAIRVLMEDATLEGEDVVPGFRCPVREIFPGAVLGA